LSVAKESEVSEAAEAAEEKEAIEEAPEAAEEAEKIELVEEPEAVQPAEVTEQPVAEEAAEEEEAEVTERVEAPQAEVIEVAEEAEAVEEEAAEAEEPAEPVEAVAEAPELVEEVEAVEGKAAEAEEPAESVEVVAEAPELVEEMGELPEAAEVYYYGTGRRKTATAQVRLYPTKEPEIIVNDRQVDQYFARPTDLMHLKEPLRVTATDNMFRITIKVRGGGISGQAGAVRHGIARALTKANPELHLTLRRGGFLTRDPRMKERKKPGLKRARKAPQYTKR
jgi:small subunit ribosomal protein S9